MKVIPSGTRKRNSSTQRKRGRKMKREREKGRTVRTRGRGTARGTARGTERGGGTEVPMLRTVSMTTSQAKGYNRRPRFKSVSSLHVGCFTLLEVSDEVTMPNDKRHT